MADALLRLAATATEEPQWPPRSPYEVNLSSPNSRRRLQQRHSRLSPSPSPLKKSTTTPNLLLSRPQLQMENSDEDEDEETLQLRLQALEAKLKLKRLQNRKAKGTLSGSDAENEATIARRSISRTQTNSSSRDSTVANVGLARSKSTGNIQVPLSPTRKVTAPQEQKSPGRVLLGIDKGLTARNVSLRRAPSSARDDPFGPSIRGPASRAGSRNDGIVSSRLGSNGLKSFNERIAEFRKHEQYEKERQERRANLVAQKSKGFGVDEGELEAFRAVSQGNEAAQIRMEDHGMGRSYSRADAVRAPNGHDRSLGLRRETHFRRRDETASHPSDMPSSASQRPASRGKPIHTDSTPPSDEIRPNTPGDSSLFEGFSRTNLTRRVLPHSFLARTLEDKISTNIPSLLREVVAPHFSLPDELEENDFVVFATIASKSIPLDHKNTRKTHDPKLINLTSAEQAAASEANVNGKYMVFTLTDLKWKVDLYIFNTAYVRFRKLQPGTLVAILNPTIMPPPPGKKDTNRWSLTLNSSDDTILEIGTAKDLGWCKAMKKDGKPCETWVDNRKTNFCEFHIDRNVEQVRRGRMETQGMSAPFAPGGRSAGRYGYFGSTRHPKGGEHKSREGGGGGLLREGQQYDRSIHSTYFVAPSLGNRSAADLLDYEEDGVGSAIRQERMRKALAEQEKERSIARRLGEGGNGTGAEYLRLRHETSTTTTSSLKQSSSVQVKTTGGSDAAALGLRNNSSASVMLSPLKRKHSSASRRAEGGATAEGQEPRKKKTRFVTAKGIREAGRESFIGAAVGQHEIDLDAV